MSFSSSSRTNETLINGRRSLAGVLLLDSLALSYATLALLLSTRVDPLDIALLAAQLAPHLFTATIVYVVVRHSYNAGYLLRVAILLFSLCFVVDAAVALIRFCLFIAPSYAADMIAPLLPLAHIVRIAVALLFLFVDLVGIVFADLSQSTAFIVALRTNEQLLAHEAAQKQSAAPRAQPLPV